MEEAGNSRRYRCAAIAIRVEAASASLSVSHDKEARYQQVRSIRIAYRRVRHVTSCRLASRPKCHVALADKARSFHYTRRFRSTTHIFTCPGSRERDGEASPRFLLENSTTTIASSGDTGTGVLTNTRQESPSLLRPPIADLSRQANAYLGTFTIDPEGKKIRDPAAGA